jgi:protein SCO1/2
MRLAHGIAAVASALLAALPAHGHGPNPAAGVGFDPHPGAQLPMELPLVDDAGRAVTLGDALGTKPAVLVLGYLACRDLCPTTLAGATHALRASGLDPGRDYRALFVSIDPRESVAELRKEKAERIGARARGAWTFLRGEAPAIARLARGVGFRYRYEPARDAFAHAAGFVVLTPAGTVSSYFPGVSFDGGALATALRDAGAGAEGPAASPLLLLCYHFDPRTGRYTLAILDLLRAAIAVFFVGIALWAWRQHRRKRAAREGGA